MVSDSNNSGEVTTHTLERLTINYSAAEDRLSIVAALPDGETLLFWLSRRMLKLLLPRLFLWLEQQNNAVLTPLQSKETVIKKDMAAASVSAHLAFAQSSAQVSMQAQAPVQASENTRQSVLTALNVRTQDKQLALLLPISDDENGIIIFNATSLGQYLGILYHHCIEAEWDLSRWPIWFTEAQKASRIGGKMH